MRNANIELQRMGEMSAGRNELSPDAAAEAILGLDGAEGVTMTVTPEGAGEHLMVAVDGSRAFLGLERSDGLLQFAVHGDSLDGVHAFSIGGQGAEIEERYLPEIRTAASTVVTSSPTTAPQVRVQAAPPRESHEYISTRRHMSARPVE